MESTKGEKEIESFFVIGAKSRTAKLPLSSAEGLFFRFNQMIGDHTIELSSVASTNNYVAEHLESGKLSDGTAIIAYDQFGGRGQGGRSWSMLPGKDLAASILLIPKASSLDAVTWNKLLTLSILDGLKDCCPYDYRIKWPNDLMVGDLKLAGLLIEASWVQGAPKHIIIGFGVNIGGEEMEVPKGAISLKMLGHNTSPRDVLKSVCEAMDRRMQPVPAHESIGNEYDSCLWRLGGIVRIKGPSETVEGILKGIDVHGRLRLEVDSQESAFPHGPYRLIKD